MKFSTIARGVVAAVLLTIFMPQMLQAWEPLKVHPLNSRIMEFRGRPQVLYTVAEHYGSVVNRDFDYVPYLNVMERDGMNLTRLFLAGFRHDNRVPANDPLAPTPAAFLQPWKRSTTAGNALDGQGKWDFSEWDDAYFTRLDAFMQDCSDRGIVVELTFFSTYYTEGEWRNSPFHPSNNVQGVGPISRYDAIRQLDVGLTAAKEAYVRKIVREVNRFDNFYFEIHNEPFWNEPGIKDDQEVAFHTRMLEIIREEEALLPNRHLVAHNFPQQMNAMSSDFEILNDHYPVAVPGTTLAGSEALLRDHYSRGKILAMGEGDTETEPQVRLETWMFLTGGGAIYNGLAFTNTIYTTDNEAGDNAFGNAARGSIRKAAKFINSLDLVSLRRDLSWVRSGIPTGATLQAMANPGQQHVAYFHHGRGGLVNFQLAYDPIDDTDHQIAPVVRLEEGSWRATWVRPSDLTVLATESFDHSGGDKTLAPVTYQADVALRIDRTGAGDLTPPPPPSGLSATPQADGSIRLSWTPADSADVVAHRIYRANAAGVIVAPGQLLDEATVPEAVFTDLTTAVGETSYYLITALDSNGNESPPSGEAGATALLENMPFGSAPHLIPGIIQMEDFDRGGQGIAFNDLTPQNEGGQYRPTEAVDIETTTDAGGGHHVFATQPGEWLEYTANVAEAGVYRVDLRTSNAAAGGEVFFELNGANISGTISIPQSTLETPWQTVVVPEVVLPAGVQIIRFAVAQAAGALNQMAFTRIITTGPTANAGADQIIMDDNFDGLATAQLNASASLAGDAPISSYSWTLGANQVATGVSPGVSLPLGIHTLRLTTTDSNFLTSTDDVIIRVNPGGFYNGSFEDGFDGWIVTGNALVKSNPPYTFTDGANLVAFNNDQSMPTGILSQTFATIPGQVYQLNFDMGVLAFNDNQQRLQVQVTGSSSLLSQTFTTNRLNGNIIRWESKSLQFTANSTSTTLSFRDLSTVTDSLDLTLDNIRVIQQISRTLVVNSSQAPGAAVTVSPADNSGQGNGIASFTRTYQNAAAVTLTAAATNAGASFSRWQKDGVDLGHNAVLNLLMDRDHTVTAIYVEGLPLITAQPTNTAVALGATATFQVVATSQSPMTYQWRFNGVPMVDEHSPSLVIPNVQSANAGDYDVIVTSVIGSVTSSAATLSLQNTASLVNGSFESNLDGWTSSGNLAVQGGAPYTATAGSKLIAFNTGQRTPNGVLSQSFGTTPGQIYQLAFDMGVLAYNNSQQRLQVELTGSASLFSQTFTTTRINGINVRWEPKTLLFTANSGTTTLTFRDLSATSDSLDLTLDNVRIIPQITRTLTVQSSPAAGASITVSPADSGGLANGTTNFTRSYPNATTVNLTAAASNAGLTFSKWRKNGVDLATTAAISVAMDANHTLTAVYVESVPVITRTLTVQSSPAAGASISVSPADRGGLANGTTNFTRSYPNATTVNLTAAASNAGLTFSKWRKNGVDLATTAAISVAMDANHTLTAVYVESVPVITRTLSVQSSPAAGASITVSPADSGGLANGTTNFTRSYPNATSVNLTAAASNAGLTFSKWRKNGVDLATTAAISVAMDANHTLTAVYVESLPVITSQPVGSVVAPGGTATFNVTATASGTLNYQWRFNGTNLLGEDEATLIISDVQTDDAGNYDVIVSNTAGPVTSSAAVLSVQSTPVVGSLVNGSFESDFAGWTTTGNLSIRAGAPYAATDGSKQVAFNSAQLVPNAVLSQPFATSPGQIYQLAFDVGVLAYNDSQQRLQVELTGSSSLASQTYVTNRVNGAAVRWDSRTILFTANSTVTTLIFRDLSTATDSLDLTLDNVRIIPQITRTLTVQSTPSIGTAITVSPSDSGGLGNGTTQFTRSYPNATNVSLTAAQTNGTLSFSKWQRNGSDFATTRTISVLMDANQTLTAVYVEGLPIITSQPVGNVVAPGGTATFNVTATGSGTLTYQWRFNGNNLIGEEDANLTISDVQPEDAGNYDVIVSNTAGPVTSSAAVLAVPTAPVGTSLINGSFESDFTGWTTTGNLMIRSGTPYAATDGIKQVGFNSGQLVPNAVLSQSFATTPGQSYQLAFDMGVVAYNDSPQRLQVELTGSSSLLSQTFVTNRINGAVVRWDAKTLLFTANSTVTTLIFRDLSTVTDSLDLTLDNVRIISQVNRNLTVQASGAANVAITVSPTDSDGLSSGTASFTRIYPNSTTVNLSAPILAGGFRFSKWQKNGVDLATTSAISLVMDGDHTLTAVYTAFTPGIPAGIKIMPLGDSITFGFHMTNAGYRGPLFSLLSPDAQGFQFVGTQTQFPGTLPASPIDQRQHQGMPGYNIQDIANNLDGLDSTRFLALGGTDKNPAGGHWLTGGGGTGRQPLFPDVITLMIGTNDMHITTGIESRLRNLLTKLTTLRPATRLFVAKITANTVYPSESAAYNASVTSLVAEFKAAGKNIYLVDLNNGFPANGLDADGVHPNSTGSSWMAQQWRDAIIASYPAIDPDGQPVITDHPDSATVPAGGSVTFEVTAVGATPLTYQWQRNSTPISGATSRTLTITNVQAANAGSYNVVVTNTNGTATSNPAQLALLSSATIVNGSFESGLDGWAHTGNLQARSASAPYTATNGTRLIAFNHANLLPNGVISQTISTTPGATYTLAFDVGVLAYNTLQQQMQVTATGQTVVLSRNITVIGLGNGTTRWVAQSFTFVADSSSTVLAFRDISTTSNGLDLLLDNVRMTIPASLAAAPSNLEKGTNSSLVIGSDTGSLGPATLSGTPGDFRISLMAPDAGSYVLQRSENLIDWEPMGEKLMEGPGLIEFKEIPSTPKPTGGVFYRIGRLPGPSQY